jgi:hypothetical protein
MMWTSFLTIFSQTLRKPMIHQAYVVHQRNMITARSAPEDNAAETAAKDMHVEEAPNPKKIFF